jgi:hypothetical protein
MTNRGFNPQTDRNAAVFLHKLNNLDFGPSRVQTNESGRPSRHVTVTGGRRDQEIRGASCCYTMPIRANRSRPLATSITFDTHISWIRNCIWRNPPSCSTTSCITSRSSASATPTMKNRFWRRPNSLRRRPSANFGWDDDDWCGTKPRPGWPRPGSDLADLGTVFFRPGRILVE